MASLAFDAEVAAKVGVNAAVVYNNLLFWCRKNRMNEQGRTDKPHFKDGRWWTYSSAKALAETFGYMTEREVRYAIEKLLAAGVLHVGSYNRSKYDRTLWFSVDDQRQFCNVDVTNLSHQGDEIVGPIPDITADIEQTPPAGAGEVPNPEEEKAIGEVIKAFEPFTPAAKDYYRRKPQREAARALIRHPKIGLSRVKVAMATLHANREDQFAPLVDSPLELSRKWAKVYRYVKPRLTNIDD